MPQRMTAKSKGARLSYSRAKLHFNRSFRLPPIADSGRDGHNGGMSDPSRYAGMTVNERLFDAGLIDAYYAAKEARDRAEMIRLLTEVAVEDAAWSADTSLIRGGPDDH